MEELRKGTKASVEDVRRILSNLERIALRRLCQGEEASIGSLHLQVRQARIKTKSPHAKRQVKCTPDQGLTHLVNLYRSLDRTPKSTSVPVTDTACGLVDRQVKGSQTCAVHAVNAALGLPEALRVDCDTFEAWAKAFQLRVLHRVDATAKTGYDAHIIQAFLQDVFKRHVKVMYARNVSRVKDKRARIAQDFPLDSCSAIIVGDQAHWKTWYRNGEGRYARWCLLDSLKPSASLIYTTAQLRAHLNTMLQDVQQTKHSAKKQENTNVALFIYPSRT